MKVSSALPVAMLVFFRLNGHAVTLEDISPHLPSEAHILWRISMSDLPKTLWTYERHSQKFPVNTVSNALYLGGFQLKPFPSSFTKPVTIWDQKGIESDPRPDYFALDPNYGTINFRRERRRVGEGEKLPNALRRRTWQYATLLGVDKELLDEGNVAHNLLVSFPRKLDGIPFKEDIEGFVVQYGEKGEIRFLGLNWPKLERLAQEKVVSAAEIERCIRAHKTPVPLEGDEPDYLGRVKSFSTIRVLTIRNVRPYYIEGRYGETPSDNGPQKFIGPVAVLDVVADWGHTNAPLKLFAPMIEPDARRLLPQTP